MTAGSNADVFRFFFTPTAKHTTNYSQPVRGHFTVDIEPKAGETN
jgi:hypothetical protein